MGFKLHRGHPPQLLPLPPSVIAPLDPSDDIHGPVFWDRAAAAPMAYRRGDVGPNTNSADYADQIAQEIPGHAWTQLAEELVLALEPDGA